MTPELWTPPRDLVVPKLPSYVVLDMAFGVGSGTTLFDKSRYRAHGAITGAAWAAGLHGYSLQFVDAEADVVTVPADYTDFDFTSDKFSIIVRVYIDDITATRTFLGRFAYNVSGWRFIALNNGAVYLQLFQALANTSASTAAAVVTTGTWYTLGASRDGATGVIYKNGVDVTLGVPALDDPVTHAAALYIGAASAAAAEPHDGRIEFLRIFKGIALPASTHLAYHNALK